MKKLLSEGEWVMYLFTGILIISWIPLLTGVIVERVNEIRALAPLTWEAWVIGSLWFIGTILVSLYWGVRMLRTALSKQDALKRRMG